MKICIISSIGRSGTTSLFDMMSLCLPRYYTCLNEPFGPFQKGHETHVIENNPNVLVKELLNHTVNNGVFPYDWMYQTFDRVIVMERRNKWEQAESHAAHSYRGVNYKTWHTRKEYDLTNIPTEYIKALADQSEDLMQYHRGKIYYYEDVFMEHNLDLLMEIMNSVGITEIPNQVLKDYFYSPKKKVRIVKTLI
jgi:hypothetical protein